MTTLDEAVQQVREGADPATVLADMQNTPLHKRDTWVTSDNSNQIDLLEMLVETKMLRLDPSSAAWVGPLVDFANDPATPVELKEGLGVLLAYLQLANRPLPVGTKPEFAELFNGMLGAMATIGVPQATIDSYVAQMTGGLLHSDVTVEQLNELAAAEDAKEAEEEAASRSRTLQIHYNTLFNTHVAPVLQTSDPNAATDAAAKAGVQAILDNWVDQITP